MSKKKTKFNFFNQLKIGWFLASRSIWRMNKSSLLMTIFIMVVVFLNLLFSDAIFAGITKGMNDNKINYQYGEIIIEPAAGERFIFNSNEIINKYKDDQSIISIEGGLSTGVNFVNEKDKDGRDSTRIPGMVMAWDNNKDQEVFNFRDKIIAGRFLKADDFGKIVLGANLSGGYGESVFPDDLEVSLGQKIKIDYGDKIVREYEVVGIFKTKNFDIDRRAILSKKELKTILGVNNETNEIIFRLKTRQDSKKLLKDLKNNFPKLEIADWEEKIAFGASIGKSFEMIGMIIKIIGALVAGLVIFIIIFVDIMNNRRQIGILKSIGISKKSILISYIFRGSFYIFTGIVLGYLLMNFVVINGFIRHPIKMPMADVIPFLEVSALKSAIIFFLLFGFVGAFIPALNVTRKKILDLLYK